MTKSKSYSPLRPKAQRKAPPYAQKGRELMILRTDDAEFSMVHLSPDNGRMRRIAYRDGRGRWLEVKVDWKRVKEAA